MKKSLSPIPSTAILALAAVLVPTLANAQLLITEINSNASEGDFWELSNLGSTSVDLSSYSWDDSHAIPGTVTLASGLSIGAGESIIFLAGGNTDTATFRSDWGIDASIQIYGDAASNGLGKDDAINLFDNTDTLVTSLSYAAGALTLSDGSLSVGGHAGVTAGGTASDSLIWDPTFGSASPRYTYADGSNFGSYAATVGDGIGSPGLTVASVPEPATCALIGLGAVGLLTIRKRQK